MHIGEQFMRMVHRAGMRQRSDDSVACSSQSSERMLSAAAGSSLLVLAGSGMQGFAHGTGHAVIVGGLLFVAGIAAVTLCFWGRRSELRAFLLTYGACVFVGGLAQCYSRDVFGDVQSTIDAYTFFHEISPQPPFATMASIRGINAPLAVVLWQQVYMVAWHLGLDFGCYTGVMLNAMVIGVAGSVTVRTARELFGDDAWRLRRAGTLFAACGLFILCGAIFIRDCFTVLTTVLVLWAIVRWLVRPTLGRLLWGTVVIAGAAYAMASLRVEAVLLFGVYVVLAFLCWVFVGRANVVRVLAVIGVLCLLPMMFGLLDSYGTTATEVQEGRMQGYSNLVSATHSSASLGMRLVVSQALPIRMVLGTGYLMIQPIPLWATMQLGLGEYDLLKAYHGVFQVLMLPFVFAGISVTARIVRTDWHRAAPFLFVVVYLLLNVAAVVATSLESRHVAQFLPAAIILAALPDTRDMPTRRMVLKITAVWFGVVILVHLAWLLMK